MNKIIYFASLFLVLMLLPLGMKAQAYHEDDKEGLRKFLRQSSAEPGKINLEMVPGLAISDTLDWNTSEAWVEKLVMEKFGLWDSNLQSKRLTNLIFYTNFSGQLAGTLDCTLFTELRTVGCPNNQLTRIIADKGSKIVTFHCYNNLLRFSTLPLLNLIRNNYAYSPQRAFRNDTIPIEQLIDLSSEYLIHGTNTVYEWVDEENNPLMLNSVGNGIFKAEASLGGKTAICRMTNQALPKLTQSYTVTFTEVKPVQIYHEDDKEGLRRFLRQASAQPGKLNFEMLGLPISDTLNWVVSEAWVEKISAPAAGYLYFSWNDQQPKRLIRLDAPSNVNPNNQFAGILDCTPFADLTTVNIPNNQLTRIIKGKDIKAWYMYCENNLLRFSTLSDIGPFRTYSPQKAFPNDTIPIEQVIDLSSEYQINGINTVYTWVDEAGAPLTLTSAGNGMFKADAALGGRTITCKMTNQKFLQLTLSHTVVLTQAVVPVQMYHEDDKEGLRRFLRQASAHPGKLNLEMLELAISDTLDWNTSEEWIEKLARKKLCSWNSNLQSTRRLSRLVLYNVMAGSFAGILDCTLFTELTQVIADNHQLTQVIADKNAKINSINCQNNLLRFSTLPALNPAYGTYTYYPQKALPTDTIPVAQVIDLSSEYQINGVNTVYEWISETGAPLTLTPAGNGMFKADATLGGKTITCQMANQAFPDLTLSYTVVLMPILPVQIYHEDDKEGLRRFFRQASAEPGKLNLEVLGLAISDTLNWNTSEEWIEKQMKRYMFQWSDDQPKRLIHLSTYYRGISPQLAGILDCTSFPELAVLFCYPNYLTQIVVGEDSKISTLMCDNNLLRFSTLPLLNISSDKYFYYPQKALPTDTIPVNQVIDLSSEYQINGVNTVYEWISETGAPLTLTPAGNGMFKADATLEGRMITCRMKNQLFPDLTLEYTVILTQAAVPLQMYHEDDKEGLRRFLRQASAEPGKLNLEVLGFALSDTLNWKTSEAWVEKLNCNWNNEQPKRLCVWVLSPNPSGSNKLAGTLDCTWFPELSEFSCNDHQITQITISENPKYFHLDCRNNLLRFSTLPTLGNGANYYYAPQKALPTDTIPVAQVIDLSSEYLIDGINTVYTWVDEQNNPVTLTSAGNGMFKANATLGGKTITCKMTNQRFSDLTLSYTIVLTPAVPVYHEDDKEGLRRFLRQASAQPDRLNLETLGLVLSDTLEWNVSEAWVEKLNTVLPVGSKEFCSWSNDAQSKRLISLTLPSRAGRNDQFAGILDCTLFTELNRLICSDNSLTQIIAKDTSNISTLYCQNNALRFSTLPVLGIPFYHYHLQAEFPFEFIRAEQIIDLSSEYLINAINTVYEWYEWDDDDNDDNNSLLTLTSVGNGMFKADAAHEGKVINCRMTNQAFPNLTLSYRFAIIPDQPMYHEDDKEGLRRFLKQASAEPGMLNLEVLGLAISDTLNWETNEEWVDKLNTLPASFGACTWNYQSPQRLTAMMLDYNYGPDNYQFAGILDCTLFTELIVVNCNNTQLTQIIVGEDSKMGWLNCPNNVLRFSTLPLLDIPSDKYIYYPQNAQPNDTIPVTQVIDLSSEYLIDGTNTVYEWVDETGAPLTLTSAGNGMFKANAALSGKTITCRMTNQRFSDLTLEYTVTLVSTEPVLTYHEDDKEGLRRFLRQASAEPGKLNLEVLGLALSDTLNWETSEAWVEKLGSSSSGTHTSFGWGNQLLKRLEVLLDPNSSNKLAGILDCTFFPELIEFSCSDNYLTQIIMNEDSKIHYLNCPDNLLRFSTLPLVNAPYYYYAPQKALPTDTIPVTQVIDLSSEYLIDGTNTIYEWVDVAGAPLTLTSAGNGMFKANAALSGKTITCRMTNQRFPDLTLEYTVTFEEAIPVAYHEDDKEGLRRFLRQASAQPGKLNLEAFGLAVSDTLQWKTSDEWIEQLNVLNSNNYEYLSWNNQHPKRLNVLRAHYSTSLAHKPAGVLDCSPFTELTRINCNNNLFTQVIVNKDAKISYLNCSGNILRFSTLPLLNKAYIYAPQKAWPTDTIPVAQVIDLSSEYLINGTNTVYQWIDEAGAPLILTSAGNGIFKADTTFEGKTITCHMTNQRFPDLTLEYKIVFIESSPEPEIITLIAHLALEESPEKDYYVASSGQRFKIFAQTLLNPDLVRIGLFKSSNGGAWIEDITQSRSGYTYTCEISQMTATNNYMIQAYTLNENGDIQVIERKAQSFTIDKLPFAFVRNALLKYTPAPETLQSHLVLNSSEKNLYCLYIDNAFKVVVNIPVVGGTRIGLFDLFGELVEDVTESVNGKLFTCRMSYGVFPGNYMLLPYKETAQGIQIIERTNGAAVMDRLPVRVDYEWNLRNSAKSAYSDIAEESEIIIYPNPVQHMLHVKADNAIEQIEIYNLQGKVFKKVIRTSEISVADLPEGMYLIRIYINDTQTSRVFKKE